MDRIDHLLNRGFSIGALKVADGGVSVITNPSARQNQVITALNFKAGDRIRVPESPNPVDLTARPESLGDAMAAYRARQELLRGQQEIRNRWATEGGVRSRVGLPVTGNLEFKQIPGGVKSEFRSGIIRHVNGGTMVEERPWVKVHWVGLECGMRQEAVDEVYGTVFCHAPAMSPTPTVVRFPGGNSTFEMGPQGSRMISSASILYYGPLLNLTIGATLIENDSGDVEEISQQIAQKIQEAGAALVGSMTGVPADAISEETWYKEGLGQACGAILDGVFGIGDDPYLPNSIPLNWQDLAKFPPPQSYQRPGEPVAIPRYTHHLDFSAVDDGGDRGHYRFYFLIEAAPWPD